MWKTGTRIEKSVELYCKSPSLGPVFRWPTKTYHLVWMRRASDRQMRRVLSLANSKEKCSNPNMKSFPCLTSDFFYQNKICPKCSEFYFSENPVIFDGFAPFKTDFGRFVGCLTERQILQNLESNSASHVILAGDMRLGPTWRCLENHPVFFNGRYIDSIHGWEFSTPCFVSFAGV